MVTRSIVGRFMILAVLLVSLGVIAQAAIIITQGSSRAAAKRNGNPAVAMASLAGTPAAAATPTMPDPAVAAAPAVAPASADAAPVRVVYPGPLGDAPVQPRKITASLSTSPLDAPVPAQTPAIQPVVSPATPVAPAATQAASAPAATPATPAPLDTVNPAATVVASAEPDAPTPPAAAAASGHGVNLNNASVAQLNSMGAGHIGQAIVQHRPYHSVDDLMKKRVVRRSIFDQIKNQVAAE